MTVEGNPITVAKRVGGKVVWKDAEKKEPELEDMDTYLCLSYVALSIPQELQTQQDSINAHHIFHALDTARKVNRKQARLNAAYKPEIILEDGIYTWVLEVMGRKVPLTKQEQELGLQPRTLDQHWWSINAYSVGCQLRPNAEFDPWPPERDGDEDLDALTDILETPAKGGGRHGL